MMRRSSGVAECRASSPCPNQDWEPVPRPLQEVAATGGRHAQPQAWLRAVVWLVEARLHPRAGETTLRIAQDLAARMDYVAGTVLYDLTGTAGRCGISTATVKRHVRALRELGALAWVRHGSRANLRLPGRPYAGTATIYAATVPASYDEAHGHRLDGEGFTARVTGFTVAGRERAIAAAQVQPHPVDNSASTKARCPGRAPQSLGRYPNVRKAYAGGGLKDTARKRAPRTTAYPSSSTSNEAGRVREPRSPQRVAQDIHVARTVRPLVGWTQGEGLRRLAFALRPLIDQGLDVHDIAAELTAWWVDWRPVRPAALITARLRARPSHGAAEHPGEAAHARAAGPSGNAAWQAWLQRRDQESAADPPRTDGDREFARLYGWNQWEEVALHYDEDPDDALDLYGSRLCCYAVKRSAETALQGLRAGSAVRNLPVGLP
ncbi:cell wall protein [Streptomyces sp. NPDC052164]|uniref:cell wall protein n=1 Tax=Streptomyces sp. NPDC052164 TaxID=3155529 RepID=UPI003440FB32